MPTRSTAATATTRRTAREKIFGGDGNDTITAADGLVDEIDRGLGLDTVVSHDTGLDIVADSCETSIPAAATVAGN
jgi:hypothetical protein